MAHPFLQHLTDDDFDDLLLGTEPRSVRVHSETCPACHETARLDQEVVAGLRRLPRLAPRAGFAERVMAGVRLGSTPAFL